MPQIELGGVLHNAFADVAFADGYLAGDVMRAAPWALRNAEAKGRGLISATRMMLQLPWCDDAVPAFDGAPDAVKEVTAMLASDLLAKPKLFADASGSSNVKTAKAGSAQVEFFRPVEGGPMIPNALWTQLLNAGLVCGPDLGDGLNDGAFVTGICEGTRPLGGRYACDYPIAAQDYD